MEELIQEIADKTGLSPEQAQSAILAVVDHLKDKLPFGIGDKVEEYLTSGASSTASASDAEGMFGDLKSKFSSLF